VHDRRLSINARQAYVVFDQISDNGGSEIFLKMFWPFFCQTNLKNSLKL